MTSLTAQLCSPKQKAPFLLPVFRCDNQKCRSMFKKNEEAWTVNYKLHQKSQIPLLWVAL